MRLSGMFSPPFLKYWHGNSPESVLDAIRLIKNILLEAGPFDGAIGFSEGGAALLSTLMQDKLHSFSLKFLILIAPISPFDPTGERRLDKTQIQGPIIDIPTIFITGEHDPVRPLTKLAEELLPQSKTTVIEWSGGHAVPNSSQTSLWEKATAEILAITAK
ncbi:MAG: hypothetical protein Q9195_009095 [Heterodermia aff. obscurata]